MLRTKISINDDQIYHTNTKPSALGEVLWRCILSTWLIFFFLSGLTLLVVTSILIIRQMYPNMFSEAFMGATVVKILACLIFVLIFLAKNKVNKYVFLADFFYVYLLNMVFEVYILLRNLRHKNLR